MSPWPPLAPVRSRTTSSVPPRRRCCVRPSVARASGRAQLADNLERAAELTAVPEDEVLAVYTALRPGRSTAAELEEWASRLDRRGATRNGTFVREAAAAYAERGLLGT